MTIVLKRIAAQNDLEDVFLYYLYHATLMTARHFREEAERSFNTLASMPHMGARYEAAQEIWDDIRFFPVLRFPKYLIFYRPLEDGVEIMRVLHGARDIVGLFEEEPNDA